MIKIMFKTGFNNRVNIVDEENNLVGFDYESNCCEFFGVLLNGTEIYDNIELAGNLEKGDDSPRYFKNNSQLPEYINNEQNEYSIITSEGDIITFYNVHNGYYAHVVTMDLHGENITRIL